MHQSLHRSILRQSLTITWKHKYLWFFGLFVTFLGNGGEYEIFFHALSQSGKGAQFPFISTLWNGNIFSFQFFKNFLQNLFNDPLSSFVSLVIVFLFLVSLGFLIWLSVVSQGALVYCVNKIDGVRRLRIGQGIENARKHFRDIFLVNVVYYILIFLMLTLIGLPIYALVFETEANTGILLLYFVNFLIFLPLAIVVSFVTKYAVISIVTEKKDAFMALERGWKLFQQHWLPSLEMSIILFFVNLFLSLLAIIAMIFTAIPFVLFGIIGAVSVGSNIPLLLLIVFGLMALLFILIFTGMFALTFQYATWTLFFRRISEDGAVSKLIRFFGRA